MNSLLYTFPKGWLISCWRAHTNLPKLVGYLHAKANRFGSLSLGRLFPFRAKSQSDHLSLDLYVKWKGYTENHKSPTKLLPHSTFICNCVASSRKERERQKHTTNTGRLSVTKKPSMQWIAIPHHAIQQCDTYSNHILPTKLVRTFNCFGITH